MRISDWSSDVCSSDLLQRRLVRRVGAAAASGAGAAAGNRGRAADRPGDPDRDQRRDRCRWTGARIDPDAPGGTDRHAYPARPCADTLRAARSEEHTSELQSLMRISYAVFCLKKKKIEEPSN